MKSTDQYKQSESAGSNITWTQNDTVPSNNVNPVEITRIPSDEAPRNGEEFKTNHNFDDGSEDYNPKVDGVVKMDKNNPIWQYSDEQIKLGFVEKLKEQYTFVTPQNMQFLINRSDGTIQYTYRKDLAVASMKLKAENDDTEGLGKRHQVYFSRVGTGEPFFMYPEGLEAQAPGLFKDWQRQFDKQITDKDMFIKQGDEFCLYKGKDKIGKCIKSNYPFNLLAINAEFNIDVEQITQKNPALLSTLQGKIKGFSEYTVLIKTGKTTFVPKAKPNEKKPANIDMGTVENANKLPIIFRVFVVWVDDSATAPGGKQLGEVDNLQVFVFAGNVIPKDFQTNTFRNMKTEFIKVSSEYFMLWRGNKTRLPEGMAWSEDMDKDQALLDYLRKEKQNKTNTANPTFYISQGDRSHTNPYNQEYSHEEMVFLKDSISLQKKNSVADVLDGMFKKYETKTDQLGEYIKVRAQDIESALENAGFHYQDFEKLTGEVETIRVPVAGTGQVYQKTIDEKNEKGEEVPRINPEAEPGRGKEGTKVQYEDKKVRIGATDKFSWTINMDEEDDNYGWVTINRVK